MRFIAILTALMLFGITVRGATAKELEMQQAKGEFSVNLTPVLDEDEALARFSIDKEFTGDLIASSMGQMMAGGNEANGARVYVALETVIGSLHGKTGSFILAHRGTMTQNDQSLSVVIVPESGSGELRGISGSLSIEIADGEHHYILDYALPKP